MVKRNVGIYVVLCLMLSMGVQAALLVWDGTQWPHGSTSESYMIEGVGVDIAFTGAVGSLISSHAVSYGEALPTDHWKRETWANAPDALWWGNTPVVTEASPLVLTITFDTAITDLQFSLYDLDGSEVIYLTGELAGTGVYPTMVNPGLITYTPATGKLAGNGIGGDPGSAGNTATITFMDAVDTITLSYSANGGSGAMLGNLTFTVPEPATISLLVLGGAALLRRRK